MCGWRGGAGCGFGWSSGFLSGNDVGSESPWKAALGFCRCRLWYLLFLRFLNDFGRNCCRRALLFIFLKLTIRGHASHYIVGRLLVYKTRVPELFKPAQKIIVVPSRGAPAVVVYRATPNRICGYRYSSCGHSCYTGVCRGPDRRQITCGTRPQGQPTCSGRSMSPRPPRIEERTVLPVVVPFFRPDTSNSHSSETCGCPQR